MAMPSRAYGAPAVAGGFAALLGSLALVGALSGVAALTAWIPTTLAIGPVGAAAAVALGLSLFLLDDRHEGRGRRAATVLALAVALAGAACLIAAALGAAGLIGDRGVHLGPRGGLLGVSPVTGALMALLGVSLASADPQRRGACAHGRCVLAAIGVLLLAVVGWAYGVDWLRGGTSTAAIAPETILIFLVLTFAVAGMRAFDGPLALLHGGDAGARMMRILLPAALLGPVALGAVRTAAENSGLIGRREALALFTLLMTAVLVSLVVLVARRLRRTDAQLRDLALLVEAADDAIVHQTLTGTIVGWNAAAERLYGYTPNEAIGQHISMLAPRDRRDEISELLARTAAGEVTRIRTVWLTRDGAELEVALTVSPVGDGPGRVVGAAAVAHDITARREAERRSERIAGMLAEAQRLAGLGSWEIDMATEIASCSDQVYIIFGTDPADGPPDGRTPFASLVHPDDLPGYVDMLAAARECIEEGSVEYRIRRPDGEERIVHSRARCVNDGRQTRLLGTVMDVTEMRRIADQLRHLADHDALTGLINRHRFDAELERALAESRRYSRPAALVILDLDGFKQVNDTFGHPAGDELLQCVGGVLQSSVRGTDVVARLGGDEFAVILQEVDEHDALAIAQEIRDRIGAATRLAGELYEPARLGEHAVTVSIGVTLFDGETAAGREQLVVEADTAMYNAKAAGRDRCALYQGERDELRRATPSGPAAPPPVPATPPPGRTADPR